MKKSYWSCDFSHQALNAFQFALDIALSHRGSTVHLCTLWSFRFCMIQFWCLSFRLNRTWWWVEGEIDKEFDIVEKHTTKTRSELLVKCNSARFLIWSCATARETSNRHIHPWLAREPAVRELFIVQTQKNCSPRNYTCAGWKTISKAWLKTLYSRIRSKPSTRKICNEGKRTPAFLRSTTCTSCGLILAELLQPTRKPTNGSNSL